MRARDYCSKICGAKCCTEWNEFYTCSKLKANCKCSIYQKRFNDPKMLDYEVIESFKSNLVQIGNKPANKYLICGRIKKLIENEQLPKWIADQCCYVHPELLKGEFDMARKPDIRNEHIFAYREGRFEEIPAEILVKLQEINQANESAKNAGAKKPSKDKTVLVTGEE